MSTTDTRFEFNIDRLELRYDPFPIGVARPLFDDAFHTELLETYPPQEIFTTLDKVGEKFTLSEKFNGKEYEEFIRTHDAWREFHAWVKTDDFVERILETLRERNIDLGIRTDRSRLQRVTKRARALIEGGSAIKSAKLRTRFEFSMLPGAGGCVLPHTDNAAKVITLVVSMLRPDEWDDAWGGGTDVNRTKDPTLAFNRTNRQLGFDDVEVLDTLAFEPNQAVLFIKTFNSWHSVRPMTADAAVRRKTLTINIETPD